jgi:WhiB family redox-sensing transcriptional regulator
MAVVRRGQQSLAAPSTTAPDMGFPAPPPWVDDALCAETDPECFFPEKGGSTREAKAVCSRCPVAAPCLDWALEHEERFGIWGGLSERERRKVAKQLGMNLPTPTTQEEEPA